MTNNLSPFTPADEIAMLEAFADIGKRLHEIEPIAKKYPLPDLVTAISDARQAVAEAAAVVIEPEVYLDKL